MIPIPLFDTGMFRIQRDRDLGSDNHTIYFASTGYEIIHRGIFSIRLASRESVQHRLAEVEVKVVHAVGFEETLAFAVAVGATY